MKNNKGFSMVEILAAVVILGIISTIGIATITKLISNSREHYYDTQNESFIMAAKAYANDDRSLLPKEIGGARRIYLKDLISKNYIKEDIVDQNKRKCDLDKSYVNIFKKNKTDYSYVGYLNCPACTKQSSDGYCQTNSEEKPVASISLSIGKMTVEEGREEEQIKMAQGTITMKGNSSESKQLYSYSYKVYRDGILKYNSGNKRINGYSKSFNINSILSENVPGNIKVTLTVTNEDGYSKTVSNSKDYKDVIAPHCGTVTGQGATMVKNGIRMCTDAAWTENARDIWILCRDYKGSGCKQHEFSSHFTRNSGEYGKDTIEVEDVSGKKTASTVYTCIDSQNPTLTIKIYKRDSEGNKIGDVLKTFTSNTNDTEIKNLGWFNANYPDGIFFEVTASDNSVIKSYIVEKNEWDKYKSAADSDKWKTKSVNENDIYKVSIAKTAYLFNEGRRYVRFTVKDAAGNTTSLSFKAEMDKTPPKLEVTVGRCSHRGDTDCKADDFESGTTTSVTANVTTTSQTINMKNWVSKGIKINYKISDKNDLTRLWETETTFSMINEGDISKGKASNTVTSTNDTVTLNGTVSLAGVGKRQGVITAKDAAGNKVKVIINGYVANTCTATYDPNSGVFNNNANNTVQTIDYDSYFGDATDGMRNAIGGTYDAKRDYFHAESGKEWISGSKTFDQTKRYKAQEICDGMEDEANSTNSNRDKTKTLKVNWKSNTVTIKYNVNGATIKTPHNSSYSISNNLVYKDSKVFEQSYDGSGKISSNGLINYNYDEGFNSKKDYYHIDGTKVWYKNSDLSDSSPFDQTTQYDASKFCNAKTTSCTTTLYLGWRPNVCTVTFRPGTDAQQSNGAKFTANASNNILTCEYQPNNKCGDTLWNANGGHFKAKYDEYHKTRSNEWYNHTNDDTFDESTGYTAAELCPNLATGSRSITLTVNWYKAIKTNRTFHWKYKERNCEHHNDDHEDIEGFDGRPYRTYILYDYECYCKMNEDESFSGNLDTSIKSKGYEYLNNHTINRDEDNNPLATIWYTNGENGEDACKGNIPRNQHVSKVCRESNFAFDSSGSTQWHGYMWYSGRVLNPEYSSFPSADISASGNGVWLHNGKDYDEAFYGDFNPKANENTKKAQIQAACVHACKFV